MSIIPQFSFLGPKNSPHDIVQDVCGKIASESLSVREALGKRLINRDWQAAIDYVVSDLWDRVKKDAGNPQDALPASLAHLVQMVETQARDNPSSCDRFKSLNHLFVRTYGVGIDLAQPLTSLPEQIQRLGQMQDTLLERTQNTSLESTWNQAKFLLLRAPLPSPNSEKSVEEQMQDRAQASSFHKQLSLVRRINMIFAELIVIPPEIIQFSKLSRLSLSYNQISCIPKAIGTLHHLTMLELSHNQITEIPKELESLSELRLLDLGNNHLVELPKEWKAFRNLMFLHLSHNRITTIPKKLRHAWLLLSLNLSHNQIIRVPKELGLLPYLISLDLRGNTLMVIEDGIGAHPALAQDVSIQNFYQALSYPSQFPLAKLCQAIMQGKMETTESTNKDEEEMEEIKEMGIKTVQELFSTLSPDIQKEILRYLSALSGWTEEDAWRLSVFEQEKFQDRTLFIQAVREMIIKRLEALPQTEKDQVYRESHRLAARPTTLDLLWEEEHALDNLPLLADALINNEDL